LQPGQQVIHVVHVFGSIARNQATPISDIDIAFEYVANIDKDSALVASYTKANEDWGKLREDLKSKFGHQPSITGLSSFNGGQFAQVARLGKLEKQ
jgi:predicted nucleotidyltransferase